MSMLGKPVSFAAEASLWIAGAAIVAGMAGAQWTLDVPIDISSLTGPTPTSSANANPSPTEAPTLSLQTLAPGESPTASPLVAKYQAYVAKANYQFVAKYTTVQTSIVGGKPTEVDESGTMSYKNGNHSDFSRVTTDGTVKTDDTISIGSSKWERTNGGAWAKSARPATDSASDRLIFAPAALFLDDGVETKNGLQLHRLDIADPVAFSAAMVKASSGATAAQLTYTVWVDDNGVPAAIHMEGTVTGTNSGVSTNTTLVDDFRVIATSGVSITAPS
ncbi:MAG TPA: hypothetical protein VF337_07865 [Candidatus Limnocylindrales bacterium]